MQILVIDWAAEVMSIDMPKLWLVIDAHGMEHVSKIWGPFWEVTEVGRVLQLAGGNDVAIWFVENRAAFIIEVASGLLLTILLKSCCIKEFLFEWDDVQFSDKIFVSC